MISVRALMEACQSMRTQSSMAMIAKTVRIAMAMIAMTVRSNRTALFDKINQLKTNNSVSTEVAVRIRNRDTALSTNSPGNWVNYPL